ncbi:MAG: adenylate/guanylate cyclase domain-containing protein [Betaproteobacteria bacterium]|nr:adenylate/guanylate cyclase domain-containing protein [Betaproteobacteria bacterium]
MFADVSGSTALFEKLGDREAMHAVERCLKRMKRSIDGYKGKTVQIVGDELLAAFDTAEEACQAAIDMQQRIADLPPVSGLKLTIRIGLHSGVVTEGEDKLSGPAVNSAARIAGIARRDQILCSSELVSELPQPGVIAVDAMPKLGTVAENGVDFALYQIHWPSYQGGSYPNSTFGPQSHLANPPVDRLCVRYRGKAFLVDEKTPVLTIGRDLACKLTIDDRKASRQHARVERRNDGFYLIDTSTNGTFVTLSGRQEVMVRRHEMQLDGKGKVSFGASSNDPQSDLADFEHL